MKKITKKSERGMAMILSILLTAVILSIAFTLSAIFIPKIRVASEAKNSVPAAYAAESVLEWCLYVSRQSIVPEPVMRNGSTYEPLTPTQCLNSPVYAIGRYRNVTRAFELTY